MIFPQTSQWQQEASSYGFKYQKCIKLSSTNIAKISGTFKKDILEGDVTVTYFDDSSLKGFVKAGKLVGIYRQFGADTTSMNITDSSTGNKTTSGYVQLYFIAFFIQ